MGDSVVGVRFTNDIIGGREQLSSPRRWHAITYSRAITVASNAWSDFAPLTMPSM